MNDTQSKGEQSNSADNFTCDCVKCQPKPTILKSGFGYWCLDVYPKGGDFKRAPADLPFTVERVTDMYRDGSPREYVGKVIRNGKTQSVCVDANAVC